MFPIRKRRQSVTAKESHVNSLQKQKDLSIKFEKNKKKIGNFLNSLRQDPVQQSQNMSSNKPFFKINNFNSQDRNQV